MRCLAMCILRWGRSQVLRPRGQAASSTREIAIAMAGLLCEIGMGAPQLRAAWGSRSMDCDAGIQPIFKGSHGLHILEN